MLTKNQTGQIVSGLRVDRVPSIDSWTGLIIVGLKCNKRNIYQKRQNSSKGKNKIICKRGFLADQVALPWSDTTKPPIGVAMVRVSQVPKWCSGITPIKRCSDGSGSTKAPKWFCGTRPIKRRDWFRRDQVPKWCCGFRLSKGVALVRTRPSPQVIWYKALRS